VSRITLGGGIEYPLYAWSILLIENSQDIIRIIAIVMMIGETVIMKPESRYTSIAIFPAVQGPCMMTGQDSVQVIFGTIALALSTYQLDT
jgi:hypothetical protein